MLKSCRIMQFCNYCFESCKNNCSGCNVGYCNETCQEADWSGKGGHQHKCRRIDGLYDTMKSSVTTLLGASKQLKTMLSTISWIKMLQDKEFALFPLLDDVFKIHLAVANFNNTEEVRQALIHASSDNPVQAGGLAELIRSTPDAIQKLFQTLTKYLRQTLGNAAVYANKGLQSLGNYLRNFASLAQAAARTLGSAAVWLFVQLWSGFAKYILMPIRNLAERVLQWAGSVLSARAVLQPASTYISTATLWLHATWALTRGVFSKEEAAFVLKPILNGAENESSAYTPGAANFLEKLNLTWATRMKPQNLYKVAISLLRTIFNNAETLCKPLLTGFITGAASMCPASITHVLKAPRPSVLADEDKQSEVYEIVEKALPEDLVLAADLRSSFDEFVKNITRIQTKTIVSCERAFSEGSGQKMAAYLTKAAVAAHTLQKPEDVDPFGISKLVERQLELRTRIDQHTALLYARSNFEVFENATLDMSEEEWNALKKFLLDQSDLPSIVYNFAVKETPQGRFVEPLRVGILPAIPLFVAFATSFAGTWYCVDFMVNGPYSPRAVEEREQRKAVELTKENMKIIQETLLPKAVCAEYVKGNLSFANGMFQMMIDGNMPPSIAKRWYVDGTENVEFTQGNEALTQAYLSAFPNPKAVCNAMLSNHDGYTKDALKGLRYKSELMILLTDAQKEVDFDPTFAISNTKSGLAEVMAECLLEYEAFLIKNKVSVTNHPWLTNTRQTINNMAAFNSNLRMDPALRMWRKFGGIDDGPIYANPLPPLVEPHLAPSLRWMVASANAPPQCYTAGDHVSNVSITYNATAGMLMPEVSQRNTSVLEDFFANDTFGGTVVGLVNDVVVTARKGTQATGKGFEAAGRAFDTLSLSPIAVIVTVSYLIKRVANISRSWIQLPLTFGLIAIAFVFSLCFYQITTDTFQNVSQSLPQMNWSQVSNFSIDVENLEALGTSFYARVSVDTLAAVGVSLLALLVGHYFYGVITVKKEEKKILRKRKPSKTHLDRDSIEEGVRNGTIGYGDLLRMRDEGLLTKKEWNTLYNMLDWGEDF